MLVTVQPWGLQSVSGGSRLIKMLLTDAPMPVHSICTTPEPPQLSTEIDETHIPNRPFLGKLDYSRLAALGNSLDKPFQNVSRRKLREAFKELGAKVVHIVAHGYAFSAAYLAAKDLGLPVILTVHDDLRYTLKNAPHLKQSLEFLVDAWRGADARIVICEEMGEEYSKRYGDRPFVVVTDGFEKLEPISPLPAPDVRRSLYFMGLIHQGCIANLETVLQATLGRENWRLVLRCGVTELPLPAELVENVEFLPYGSQADVQADMAKATVLYQPLPIGDEYADMVRFSLSTKMVSYLGSGKPILYHGPADAATGHLLDKWDAAIAVHTLNPEEMAHALDRCVAEAESLAANAQKLATDRFVLADQHRKFWETVNQAMQAC